MEPTIFRFILKYSRPQQIFLTAVIALYFPIQYLVLELPKIIVDDAIRSLEGPPYPFSIFGFSFSADTDRIRFLLFLCFLYLIFVLGSGGVKYFINVYRGQLGERMLRRLRYQLFERMLRFPSPHFRRTSQGEIIPMITSEVEPLGGFIGTAYSDPIFQGGQLLIILGFIMAQDWVLGLAAIALYPFQMYVIPKLQRHVNALAKRRVQQVRRLSDHIGETVSGVSDVHINGTAALELSRFTDRLNQIYWIRYEIYLRKFFIKFLNNFIDKLTPFFFFSIGGYLVITGGLSVGSLLAILAAHSQIAAPWKELLTWYQQKEDMRIKYRQVVRQFVPDDMLEPALLDADAAIDHPLWKNRLSGDLVIDRISVLEDDGNPILDEVDLTVPVATHIAVIGDAYSGKSELGQILGRLQQPSSGRVSVDNHALDALPEAVWGRRAAYIDRSTFLQTGTIRDILLYGLKQYPTAERSADERNETTGQLVSRERQESRLTANSPHDFGVEWADYSYAGTRDRDAFTDRVVEVLRIVELDDHVHDLGLRSRAPSELDPRTIETFLAARNAVQNRLGEPEFEALVEPWKPDVYNGNATVAENLLFGTPRDGEEAIDEILKHPFILDLLNRTGLTVEFLIIGKRVTETVVELFADLPPGHEYFDRYNFIRHQDLKTYQGIVARSANSFDELTEEERLKILILPFKIIPNRHRFGFIHDRIQGKVLNARQAFLNDAPSDLRDRIAHFDPSVFNPSATVQDNLLFGKIAYGQAHASAKIVGLLRDVLAEQGLRNTVVEWGLETSAGVAGSALGRLERQKLVMARALIKDPDIMIVNEALAGLDIEAGKRIVRGFLEDRRGRGLIWILNRSEIAELFDNIAVMKNARIAMFGARDTVKKELQELGGL